MRLNENVNMKILIDLTFFSEQLKIAKGAHAAVAGNHYTSDYSAKPF